MKSLPPLLVNSTSYRMLALPRILKRSLSIIIFAFVFITVCLLFIPWQQTSVGDGRVIAFDPAERLQIITANLDGRIEKWYVREGDVVREGDLLARMSDNDPEIIERLKNERAALVKEIEALELNANLSSRNIERQKELLKREFSTDFNVEQAQIAEARVRRDLAAAEGRLARLDTQISRQLMLYIRSPRSGIVQNIMAGENSGLVKSGVAIARIVPQTEERTVELFVNGLDLPFIRVGQDVRLQFEGWPVLQFSGLPQISTGTFLGTIKVVDPSDNGRGQFRLIVQRKENAVWPSPELLRQGVRARGWVQMRQVPLWFEIWRLINDLPPMTPPVKGSQTADNPPTVETQPSDDSKSSTSPVTNQQP